jgi:hypothetical protein
VEFGGEDEEPWPFRWGFVCDGPGRLLAGGNRRQERGGWALVDVLRQPVFGRLVECEDEWCQVSDDALAVTKLI